MRPVVFEPADEVIAQSGVTFQLWRLYRHFWLVCLLIPFISLVSEPVVPWRLAPGVLALLFFAISYTWIMWPHPVNQETCSRHPSSGSAWQKLQRGWISGREASAIIFPQPCEILGATSIGWKQHAWLSTRNGCK